MFRTKKKLREQLEFEQEQNVALRNALLSEKNKTKSYQEMFSNMKTAHQEIRKQYDALRFKYMKETAPKELLKRELKSK